MTFYIFLGATVVLFVIGMTLIMKGMREPSREEDKVVPIADLKELQPAPAVKPQQPASASLSQQVIAENMKKPVSPIQPLPDTSSEVRELRSRLEGVLRDNHRLEEELRKEIEAKAVPQQKLDLSELEALKVGAAKMEQQLRQSEDEMGRLRKILEESRRDHQNEIVNLKGLLQQTQEDRDRVRQEYLSQMNVQQDIAAIQEKNRQLEQERNDWLARISQHQIELEEQQKQITELRNKPPVVDTAALTQTMTALEKLKNERDELLEAGRLQEKNIQKLKEFVAFLQEKEKMYQYELTKCRAQILGLERICADFKEQQTQPINRVTAAK